MKSRILNTLIGSLLLSMAAAHADVVFQDTFNAGPSTDINTDYAARQSGGTVSAPYTGTLTGSKLTGTHLRNDAAGEIVLNSNFAGAIVGNAFELSFKQTVVNGPGWSAIYLKSATETLRGTSRVGLHTYGTGTASTVYMVYGGTGASGASNTGTGVTQNEMNALWQSNFSSNFDRTQEHVIQLISTPGGGGTNTFDFVVDGVLVLNDKEYAYNDNTVRNIGMVGNLMTSGQGVLYDDLTVIPEPATLGLIGLAAAALIVVRRALG